MSKKNRRTTTSDMIQCPYCKAMSYPRVLINPITEEDKKAIFCGSCNGNLTPYIEAVKKYEERMKEEYEKEQVENGITLVNDEGVSESYPDAVQIASEVLT